ncbi:MAG: CSLREA domain-containing protein [Thermoleophilia bacterium]|nr:CSLREA domain-containing protein [Thermoleophilia bacterium]
MPAAHIRLVLTTFLVAAVPAAAADITVTTTADGLTADGLCSLREAVTAAQLGTAFLGCASGTAGPDTVVLGAATYAIALPGFDDANATGDLDVGAGGDVRILGAGPGATVIDGGGVDRVLDVPATAALTLDGLTVRGGRAQPGGFGGGVRNAGRLVALRATFTDNRSGAAMPVPPGALGDTGPGGGAVSSSGATAELAVLDSTFDGNRASDGGQGGPSMATPGPGGRGGDGGAILVLSGTASVHGSTFTGNLAGAGGPGGAPSTPGGQGGNGGAVAVFGGNVGIANSTFGANRAGEPGAGNGSAGGGGGGAIAGGLGPTASTSAAYVTFAGNMRGTGSTDGNAVTGALLGGVLLADAAPVCSFAPIVRTSLVPVGDTSCGAGAVQGDARLGPLADNGGPTRTMLPGEGGAAIDIVPLCQVSFPLGDVDQRGVPRIQRAGCDAGAVEVQPPPPGTPPAPGGGTPAGPSPTGGVPASAPVLSRLRITPGIVRAGTRPLVSFRLTAPGRVRLTVRRMLPGRRLGGRCVPPRSAPRAARSCSRPGAARAFVRAVPGTTGAVRLGVLGPGRSVLTARPVGGTATARPFRVTSR